MLKNREKFWSFLVLVVAIMTLACVSVFLGTELTRSEVINDAAQSIFTARLRILELIAVGLIGIAGAAGQALFRTSENADSMNEILKSTIEGLKQSTPSQDLKKVPEDAVQGAEQAQDAVAEVVDDLHARAESPWNKEK